MEHDFSGHAPLKVVFMRFFFKKEFITVFATALVLLFLLSSCSDSQDQEPFLGPVAITAFSFEDEAGDAQIDHENLKITVNARCETNLSEIVPQFTLFPENSVARIGGIRQASGRSEVDFSQGPVVYILTTADGSVTSEWEVSITYSEACQPNWEVNLQRRNTSGVAEKFTEKWDPQQTAIIVCDMWPAEAAEKCAHNSAREIDLALAMNEVFKVAREMGILIVFAPSDDTEKFEQWYGHLPARQTSAKYRHGYGNPRHWDFWWHGKGGENEWSRLAFPGEKYAGGFPRESGRGCDYHTTPNQPQPPQMKELIIDDRDIITDDFVEMIGGTVDNKTYNECLFKERGIRNVIMTGCHTDICVIGRPFGCRALVMAGYNAVLCRDLTNHTLNCNMFEPNGHSHIEKLNEICNYVETWICPTITSTEITGKPAFEFDEKKIQNMFPPR